jgi:hypothetical protein
MLSWLDRIDLLYRDHRQFLGNLGYHGVLHLTNLSNLLLLIQSSGLQSPSKKLRSAICGNGKMRKYYIVLGWFRLIIRYTEMKRATEERGSYIDQLGEQMNNASVSASNYLTQARNNAVS